MLFRVKSSKCISKCEQAHGRWEKKRDAKECGKFAFFPWPSNISVEHLSFLSSSQLLEPSSVGSSSLWNTSKTEKSSNSEFWEKKIMWNDTKCCPKGKQSLSSGTFSLFLSSIHCSSCVFFHFSTEAFLVFRSGKKGWWSLDFSSKHICLSCDWFFNKKCLKRNDVV